MLVLTRNAGQKIMIGENITVIVLGINGGQVRIGVDAPVNVAVHREEVLERIKAEGLEESECNGF